MVMVGDLVIWWFGDYGYFVVRLNCRAAYALRIVRSAKKTGAKSVCKYGSKTDLRVKLNPFSYPFEM